MTKPETLTPADVRRLFDYQDGQLIWKTYNGPNAIEGSAAGYPAATRRVVNIRLRTYTIARLVFAWHTGAFPRHYVAHLNGNTFDDRIENLADMTMPQIRAHKAKLEQRTPGITPVRGKRWQVTIRRVYIGTYLTKEEAFVAYKKAHVDIYGEKSPYADGGM